MEEGGRDEPGYFRTLFNNSPDGVYLLDAEGVILDVNSRASENLGYDREELLGKTIHEFGTTGGVHPFDRPDEDFEGDGVLTVEGRHTRADGSHYPVEARMVDLDVEGEPRFLAISRDVTALKEHEAALERKNEELEEFATLLSHDLGNLLNIATGNLRLAREEVDNEYLSTVANSLERMDDLLQQVLTLARQGRTIGERTTVQLKELVAERAEGLEHSNIDIAVTGSVSADRDRLAQVVDNLLRNAIEHGGEGVRVEVGDLDNGFYIRDDGPGFPAGDPSELLESGSTTKEDGGGLGLYIVRRIVEAHGWTIDLIDCHGDGARVEIRDMDSVTEE